MSERKADDQRDQASCTIKLEKKGGYPNYKSVIEASDAETAMNGLAILVVKMASAIGVNALEVLALLSVVLTREQED